MSTEQKTNNKNTRYKKGQSGNPGGRPKTRGIVKYIRSKVGENYEEVINNLYDIMNGTKFSPSNRIKAMEVLLDRGMGKPHQSQSIDLDHKINTPLGELLDGIDDKSGTTTDKPHNTLEE